MASYRAGKTTIRVDDVVERMVEQVTASPHAEDSIRAHVEAVERNAVTKAPVRTGEYRKSIRSEVTASGTRVAGSVEATAPHVPYLRSGGRMVWRVDAEQYAEDRESDMLEAAALRLLEAHDG